MFKPTPQSPLALAQLYSGAPLGDFFQRATGFTPDPNYFGAYAVAAAGNQLYIGIGAARPGEYDGALLASTEGRTLKAVYQPAEQGFVGLTYAGGTLYFPGPDPMEDWTLGNIYQVTPPGTVTKQRALVNVIHSWGLYPDVAAQRLYAAVGQHAGDNATFFGGIFISTDRGATWEAVKDPDRILGRYRTYDVIGLRNALYATVNDDYAMESVLAKSNDRGATWKRLDVAVQSRPRLFATPNYVIAMRANRGGLVVIDSLGRKREANFKGFLAADWAYNFITADSEGWHYLLAEGGNIMMSRDLRNWNVLLATGLNLTTVGYWPLKDWLVVGDRGAKAGLWWLDLAAVRQRARVGKLPLDPVLPPDWTA